MQVHLYKIGSAIFGWREGQLAINVVDSYCHHYYDRGHILLIIQGKIYYKSRWIKIRYETNDIPS